MDESKCQSDVCERKPTHRVVWKETGISVLLCAEHINVFILDQLEVTTDLESEWRLPSQAQKILDGMVKQARVYLEEGAVADAATAVGIAISHVGNCSESGIELNTDALQEVSDMCVAAGAENGRPEGSTS